MAKSDRTPNPTAAPQDVKDPSDPTRREPSDDPKFDERPLREPSGNKGDLPENPDRFSETTNPDGSSTRSAASTAGVNAPGTVIRDQGTGQSREILLPDGTPAGSTSSTQTPGGGDAVPSWGEPASETRRAEAKGLPSEEEALRQLEQNPERSSVLSDKGHVTRDRLHRVVTTTESRSGIAELNVKTEGGNVTVNKAPV